MDSVDAGNKMSNMIPGSAIFTFDTCLIMLVCLVFTKFASSLQPQEYSVSLVSGPINYGA